VDGALKQPQGSGTCNTCPGQDQGVVPRRSLLTLSHSIFSKGRTKKYIKDGTKEELKTASQNASRVQLGVSGCNAYPKKTDDTRRLVRKTDGGLVCTVKLRLIPSSFQPQTTTTLLFKKVNTSGAFLML
jgi:hypothetical protein